MAQVYPFPAFRYNASKVSYGNVLTQPYDKISPSMQDKYYAADPHNLIAIEKGRVFPGDTPAGVPDEKNVYTRAEEALQSWIREQVVVPDSRPCFYSYTQEYTVPGTQQRLTRRGFIGAGKLEEYSAGVVFRHEHTLSGPKADRLELLRHTQTHTGQLFLLYSDPARVIDKILAQAESESAPVASTINFAAVRDQSVSRKTQVSDEFNTVNQRYRENQAVIEPLISYLQDIRTALSTDLTEGGLQSVKPLAENAEQNARKVQTALARLADDLSASRTQMSSVVVRETQPEGSAGDTPETTQQHAQSSP